MAMIPPRTISWKQPKIRPVVYAPSWKQMGKGGTYTAPAAVVPKIKITSTD